MGIDLCCGVACRAKSDIVLRNSLTNKIKSR